MEESDCYDYLEMANKGLIPDDYVRASIRPQPVIPLAARWQAGPHQSCRHSPLAKSPIMEQRTGSSVAILGCKLHLIRPDQNRAEIISC